MYVELLSISDHTHRTKNASRKPYRWAKIFIQETDDEESYYTHALLWESLLYKYEEYFYIPYEEGTSVQADYHNGLFYLTSPNAPNSPAVQRHPPHQHGGFIEETPEEIETRELDELYEELNTPEHHEAVQQIFILTEKNDVKYKKKIAKLQKKIDKLNAKIINPRIIL